MNPRNPEQYSLNDPEAVILGSDLHEWHDRMEELMTDNARIIALRGAGTVNGIELGAAEIVTSILRDYVADMTTKGVPVVLMYDGDGDDRQKPDLGSVFGGLADSLSENSNVIAIAAQTKGWYSPKTPAEPIKSASGRPYETYVFPDDVPGAHASLTQSDALVSYAGYEQVFVGPVGPIALDQLNDLSRKVANRSPEIGDLKVTVLATPINPVIDNELRAQLDSVTDDQACKASAKLEQRAQYPYGALFTAEGDFALDATRYAGIEFAVHAIRK